MLHPARSDNIWIRRRREHWDLFRTTSANFSRLPWFFKWLVDTLIQVTAQQRELRKWLKINLNMVWSWLWNLGARRRQRLSTFKITRLQWGLAHYLVERHGPLPSSQPSWSRQTLQRYAVRVHWQRMQRLNVEDDQAGSRIQSRWSSLRRSLYLEGIWFST
jgi:hypothetical protein